MSVGPTDSAQQRNYELQTKVAQEERDAQKKIAAAQDRVKEAYDSTNTQINNLKDEFEKEVQTQQIYQEDRLAQVRENSEQELQTTRLRQMEQISDMRKKGDRSIEQLNDFYSNTQHQSEQNAKRQLTDAQNKNRGQIEIENQESQFVLQKNRSENVRRFQDELEQRNSKLKNLDLQKRSEYEKRLDEHAQNTTKSREKFANSYEQTLAEQQSALSRLNDRATKNLETIRDDSSRKLQAYADRQRDPFYQLVDLNADFRENPDAYVLSAAIPSHEKDNVRVSVQNDRVVIRGNRQNEEDLNTEDGGKKRTSSFQSFMQSFPIAWPVDSNAIEQEYRDGVMTYTFPKKGAVSKQFTRPAPERARAHPSLPQFPKNLPETKEEPKQTASHAHEDRPLG